MVVWEGGRERGGFYVGLPLCYVLPMDPLSPKAIQRRIDELKKEREPLASQLEKIDEELNWLLRGLVVYGEKGVGKSSAVTMNGRKPTLRQAILTVMKAGSRIEWTSAEVIQALDDRGWLPQGKYATHTVRQRLRDMANSGEIRKVGRGKFALKEAEVPA